MKRKTAMSGRRREEEETDDEEEIDEEDGVKSDVEINDNKEYDDMITPNLSTQVFTILAEYGTVQSFVRFHNRIESTNAATNAV
eukprot:CAMPEP_0194166084 /NCGR_PEP_ID=MMETSP0154-20130528/1798_1 /TAXON_ID=1049557 /ORGANISM="Thalassiothrix antarctica, Strain L6-D1" /LENGTH=83 /DNA_ID=CAMNT_0038876665 /DNA_START=170 /DNA_END=419 /DNA_ORIENTATION=-